MVKKRVLCLLLTGLLLSGCAQSSPSISNTPTAPESSAPPDAPAVQTAPEQAVAVYDFDTVQIALPMEHWEQIIVETGPDDCEADQPLYPRTLMTVYEKASVEAAEADFGDAADIGFLWGFCELDEATFQDHLAFEPPGSTLFAKKDGLYYAYLYPTDVQFYRSGDLADATAEDWAQWEMLNTLGAEVCRDFIERNELEPCSARDFYDRPFTWDGANAYVQYYPYYTFDGSKREFDTLVLSQPARQGEGGIWCVERVYDVYGTPSLHFPDGDIPAAEYYAALQAECDAGLHSELLTPLGAAGHFVSESLRHSEDISSENLVLTDDLDDDYMETNRIMSQTIVALLVRPDTVTDAEVLECIGRFRADTWGVMGRYNYGSDWWTPLQEALKRCAAGSGQTERNTAMMHFYCTSYGPYADFIGKLLQAQQEADPAAFEEALMERSSNEQAILRSALERP